RDGDVDRARLWYRADAWRMHGELRDDERRVAAADAQSGVRAVCARLCAGRLAAFGVQPHVRFAETFYGRRDCRAPAAAAAGFPTQRENSEQMARRRLRRGHADARIDYVWP